MLASYVGEDRFLKGVSLYLKKHTYKNSVTKDLWEGIQAATGNSFDHIFLPHRNLVCFRLGHPQDDGQLGKEGRIYLCICMVGIQHLMQFSLKMGYPIVTVTEKEGGIHLRQDRFLETGPADAKDNETIWYVHAQWDWNPSNCYLGLFLSTC